MKRLLIALLSISLTAPMFAQTRPEAQEDSLVEMSEGKADPAQKETGTSYNAVDRLKNRIAKTWNEGNPDLIVTIHAWHNRLTYDREKTRKYNENAWGGGFGRSMYDEDGDTHMLFVTVFQDSWKNPQYYGGYAFLKNKHFGTNNAFRVGGGFSLGITGRHEFSYIPLPLPLPIAGIGYKQLSIEAAYVPGTRNNGNVLFTWARLTF